MSCINFCFKTPINVTVHENPLQRVIRRSITITTYNPENKHHQEYRVSKNIIAISKILSQLSQKSIDGSISFPSTQITYPDLKRLIKLIESEGKSINPLLLEQDMYLFDFLDIEDKYIQVYISKYIKLANETQLFFLWKHYSIYIDKPNILLWMEELNDRINPRNCSNIKNMIDKYNIEKIMNLGEGKEYYSKIQNKIIETYTQIPHSKRRLSKSEKIVKMQEKILVY